MERFNGAEAWLQLDPIAQQMLGAIALELVVSWVMTDRSIDPDGITWRDAPAGRANEHASHRLSDLLEDAVLSALPQAVVGPDAPFAVSSLIGPVCRVCGCSEDDACEGGCSWVEPGLCSACAGKAA